MQHISALNLSSFDGSSCWSFPIPRGKLLALPLNNCFIIYYFFRQIKEKLLFSIFKYCLILSAPKRHFCRLTVERQSDIFVVLYNRNTQSSISWYSVINIEFFIGICISQNLILRRRSSWDSPVNYDLIFHDDVIRSCSWN
jgi:hypothetical protein